MKTKRLRYAWKKGIAVLGAVLMLLQSPLAAAAAYADNTGLGTWTGSGQEAVSENNISVSEKSVSDNSVSEVEIEEDISGPVTESLGVNYAYIENAQISASQTQNILVSLGAAGLVWKDALLKIVNTTTGEEKEIPFTDASDEVLRFAFDTTGYAAGVYRVAEITYSYMDGETLKEGVNVFADIAQMENICFGLDVENPLTESEFTQYDEGGDEVAQEGLDIDVIPLNDEDSKVPSDEEVDSENRVAGSLVVMLDPGHDATHAGARANGLEEEKLTLKVAKYCKEYLEEHYSDVVVYMSREGEACPYPGTASADCNAARVAAAKAKGADVYVSLHFNSTAGGATSANGAIVFYPNSNYDGDAGSEGAALAAKIIEQLEKLGLTNNGIRIRNSEDGTTYPDGSLADYYGVIRRSKLEGIPAVIIEHAFLNNISDAGFLQNEDNLKNLGKADALGIAQAYKLSTEEVEYDAEDLTVTEIDGASGTFKITLSGASPVKRIANIKFKVYPTQAKDQAYTYTAELIDEKKGIYSVIGNVGMHGKKDGDYKVIAYAYNAAGKKTQLRSAKFTIEKAKTDTDNMSIATKVYSNEKNVLVKLNGNPNASSVYFKVYSKAAGSKKAKNYKAKKLENGQWSAKVKTADHKRAGEYVVQAYATNHFGVKEKVATGAYTIVGPKVKSLSITKLNLTKGTFRVVSKGVTSASGVKKVTAIVKTLDGKKLRKTYTMKKTKSGNYYADVNMKSFQYQYATYGVYIKVKDGNGIEETVQTLEKEIVQPDPVLKMKLKSKHTKITMTASELGISANVKGVKFKVYHVSNSSKKKSYTAKKKDGVYTATMKVSDFGKSGAYKVITYVKGANGKYKKVGKTQTINVPDIQGGSVKLKKRSDNSSYLYVTDIAYEGDMKSVQVKVWPVTDKKAKYTYKTSRRSDGSYRAAVDSKKHKGIGGEYKYQVIVESKNGIRKVLLKGSMTLGQSTPEQDELYAISGDSNVTVNQMMRYYKANAVYPSFYESSDASTLKKFCQIYYDECEAEGIRVEVAFTQAMKETNFLRFGGDVDISQYNFAGIGATGGGVQGNSFASVRLGVRAQVQHLKAYANHEPLAKTKVDPRFDYVTRGCAPYVEWLSIKTNPYGKGWATDPTYGTSLRQMITTLRNC